MNSVEPQNDDYEKYLKIFTQFNQIENAFNNQEKVVKCFENVKTECVAINYDNVFLKDEVKIKILCRCYLIALKHFIANFKHFKQVEIHFKDV
eukprot:UN09460